MKVADCMTRDVQTVSPEQPIREAEFTREELLRPLERWFFGHRRS